MLILALLVILAIAGADQLIKYWIVQNFELYQEKDFLKIGNLDIMHLHYIENTGSAFSSFAGHTIFLLIVTAVGMGACIYGLVRYGKKNKVLFWSLVMILGGALGNMIDRIFRSGAVVDYLDLKLFNFAVFNFADCFVTVGTILLMIYILFFSDKDTEKEKEKAQEHTDDKT
ncbi:MAG: signal peptidase II [Oscillospiraceae bacterium]|nr:signal peptidase II [Oscillospiraceae bacterium]